MNVDYKELLRRYVGTVRRHNDGEDFVDHLPLADQRAIRSIVAPNTSHLEPTIASGNKSGGWFSNFVRR